MSRILCLLLAWRGSAACITAVDCAMNGECVHGGSPAAVDPQLPGECACSAGWKGAHCEVLDLAPSPRAGGLRLPHNGSTWGGSIIEWNGTWHMYASHMVGGCGLDEWTTNSEVLHAVAEQPGGPYEARDVVLPTWAHDTNAIVAPTGEIVIFVTGKAGVVPRNCTGPGGGARQQQQQQQQQQQAPTPPPTPNAPHAPPKDSYMIWATSPEGPWSEPVMVINSTKWNSDYFNKTGHIATCDTNLNGIIRDDGSLRGLWRRCETDQLYTIPHTLFASDWRDASSYAPDPHPLFVLGGSGAEDPSNVWVTQSADGTEAYHALFHDEQATRCMLPTGCSANGRHAFSLDGRAWRYANEDAWTRNVSFDDGSTLTANTRARPHVLLDKSGRLTHLSTGLEMGAGGGAAGSDYVWTLVTPLHGKD